MTASLAPRDLEAELRKRAEIIVEQRKAAGVWDLVTVAHVEYQGRPLAWMVEKMGIPEHTIRWSLDAGYEFHQWDGDRDPLVKVCEAVGDWKDCGVESATGTGKTFLAALLVLCFLACYQDSLVVTGAPKEDQLLQHLWMEIGKLWGTFSQHFPDAQLLTGKIRMRSTDDPDKEGWGATAFVAGTGAAEISATKAQGFHREHMLIITEETPGMEPAIMTAFSNTRTDDHNIHLALGNPDHRADQLHLFCFDEKGKPRPGVVHVRISAFDHPNVVTGRAIIPGAIGKNRLDTRINDYGEGSRLYQSRIRGISPSESAAALIKREWCVAAAARYNDTALREGPLGMGVDVAQSENGDKAAIARGQGACLTEVESFPCPNADHLGERVVTECRDLTSPIDPRYVGIDPVGVGASVVNTCRRLEFKVRHLAGNVRAIPGLETDTLWSEVETDLEGHLRAAGPVVIQAERFANLRSQMHWQMREDLRLGKIALPDDTELWEDLCTAEFTTKNGQIVVEAKEDIIARLGRSPNKADAAIYWNFVRRRRPERQPKPSEMPNMKNRDMGLERRLAAHAKRMKLEERRIRRMFKRPRKGAA